jgi:hypothetical protein
MKMTVFDVVLVVWLLALFQSSSEAACFMMGPPARGGVAREAPAAVVERATASAESRNLPGVGVGNAELGRRVYVARRPVGERDAIRRPHQAGGIELDQ